MPIPYLSPGRSRVMPMPSPQPAFRQVSVIPMPTPLPVCKHVGRDYLFSTLLPVPSFLQVINSLYRALPEHYSIGSPGSDLKSDFTISYGRSSLYYCSRSLLSVGHGQHLVRKNYVNKRAFRIFDYPDLFILLVYGIAMIMKC